MTPAETSALIDRLHRCDVPTVCNAIEVAQGARGFSGFTHRSVVWTGKNDARIVGFARTARITGNRPSSEPVNEIRARRMAYFEAMNAGSRPGVAVIEDTDGDAAIGAWWGEVHAKVHKEIFGLSGAVTNGVVRDLGDMPDGFPILAGSVGPSHGFVHVQDIGRPVTVFDMTVSDDDLIVADRHGAICIPADVIPKLDAAIDQLLETEAVVLDPLKNGSVDFETFKSLWAKFEKIRK